MKRLTLLFFFLGIFFTANAQSKKEIKKYKIKSVSEMDISGGKTLYDSKKVFDANGEVKEETSYDKFGKIKSVIQSKHNDLGDVIEEVEFEGKNKFKEKRIIKYNDNKDKSEEEVLDATGKLIKKHIYVYDSKGLKVERKTLDANGKVKSIKKYNYEFNN